MCVCVYDPQKTFSWISDLQKHYGSHYQWSKIRIRDLRNKYFFTDKKNLNNDCVFFFSIYCRFLTPHSNYVNHHPYYTKKETTYKHFTSSILLYKSRIIKMLKLILKKVVLGMEKHLPDWLQSSWVSLGNRWACPEFWLCFQMAAGGLKE